MNFPQDKMDNMLALDISPENLPRIKKRLHIIIGSLVSLTFILTIARVADRGTPSTRANTWGIAVCLKSGVFLTYQVLTTHKERFKKWASTKANLILNIVDTVFWFALIIISIMGAAGSKNTSSRALGAIIVVLGFVLFGFASVLSFVSVRDRQFFKRGISAKSPSMGEHSAC